MTCCLSVQAKTQALIEILKTITARRHGSAMPQDAGLSLFVQVKEDPAAADLENPDEAKLLKVLDVTVYCDIAMMGDTIDSVRCSLCL